jgi:uncharacterized protein (TIRG00374 family)
LTERLVRFAPLVGIALLALLLRHLDFREAWRATQAIPANSALLACGAYTLNAFLKALRWHRMLQHQRAHIPVHVSFAAFMSGAFYGMLTIGRLGELLRAEALMQHGQTKANAFANAIADRILDAAFLLVVAAACSALMLPSALASSILALLVVGWGGLVWRQRSPSRQRIDGSNGAASQSTAPTFSARVRRATSNLVEGLRRILFGPGASETLLWTALSWSAYFLAIRTLAAGLGIHAPLEAIVRAIALGTAAAALPISFQGLGTREAALTATLAPYGVSTTQALTLSLLSLLLFYVVLLPLGGAGVVWRQWQRTVRANEQPRLS